ncbi:unnamed protein product, partial [Mesorhabditis belari]|uniref:1-acyl-sn-glycerol-3-phosphate acyltransferase n=1 Tax=Mesorhabditis belari TaxID=2138241 RepID=A0AAF3FTA8_9BILA
MIECSPCLLISASLLLTFILLYRVSQSFRYYSRVTFFYLCIFLHGMECCVTQIPFYFLGWGAYWIFYSFYYWCWWTGIRVEVRDFDKHLEHLKGPAIVVCNHQSAIDVFSMSAVFPPRGTVMMKKSLQWIPFFNITSWLARSIYIDRFNREKALEQVEYCSKLVLERKLKVWVFPEGTRYRDQGMLPFKKGAFNIAVKAQVPIVPIVCSNYSPFYSKKDKYFHSDGEVIIQVLPAVETQGLSLDDVNDLCERVRNDMLKAYDKITPEAAERMATKRAKKQQ